MVANDGTVVIEGAQIRFRNFAGLEGAYNAAGKRTFCVLLDEPLASEMAADGWNVKLLKPREDGDVPQPYIQVHAQYRNKKGELMRPPRVVLVTSRGKTDIPEELVETLDWVDIRDVDLIIRPYNWEMNGKTGVSAKLKSMYIQIQEDALEQKYADVPELNPSGEPLAIEGGDDPDIIDGEFWEEDDTKAIGA